MAIRIMCYLAFVLLHLTLHGCSRSGKGHGDHHWSEDSDWIPNWHTHEPSDHKHWTNWFKDTTHDREEMLRWKSKLCRMGDMIPGMENMCKSGKSHKRNEDNFMRNLERQLEKEKEETQRVKAEKDKLEEQLEQERIEKKKVELEKNERLKNEQFQHMEQEDRAEKRRLQREQKEHEVKKRMERHAWKHNAATRKFDRELEEEKKKYQQLEDEVDQMKTKLRNEKEDRKIFVQHLELQREHAERTSHHREASLVDLQSKLDAKDLELQRTRNNCENTCRQSFLQNISAMAAEQHLLSEVFQALGQEKEQSSQLFDALQKEKELSSQLQSSARESQTTFLLPLSITIAGIISSLLCYWHTASREEMYKKQLYLKDDLLARQKGEMDSEFGGMMKLGGVSDNLSGDFSHHIFDEQLDQGKVRSIKILCPGVSHSDIHIDIIFNGCVVTIDRKPCRGVTPTKWTHKFQFRPSDGLFEFKEDQAALEAGILMLVFRAYAFQSRVFRFPTHFDMAHHDIDGRWDYPDDDASNGMEPSAHVPSAHVTAPGRLEQTAATLATQVQPVERAAVTTGSAIDTEDYNAITIGLMGIEEPIRASPRIVDERELGSVTDVLSSIGTSEGFEKVDVEEPEMNVYA